MGHVEASFDLCERWSENRQCLGRPAIVLFEWCTILVNRRVRGLLQLLQLVSRNRLVAQGVAVLLILLGRAPAFNGGMVEIALRRVTPMLLEEIRRHRQLME